MFKDVCDQSDDKERLYDRLRGSRPRIGVVKRHSADNVTDDDWRDRIVELFDEMLFGFGGFDISLGWLLPLWSTLRSVGRYGDVLLRADFRL